MISNIYKLQSVKTKKVSKTNYTKKGAIAYQKKYAEKGIETKIVLFKQKAKILDTSSDITGIVESFRETLVDSKGRK